MTKSNQLTLVKLYHIIFLGIFIFPFFFMFVDFLPPLIYALAALTALALIILDLCLSGASRSEKVAWSLVIFMLHWFVLPFYWFAFLRKGRNSWCLERLFENPRP